jgi:hypothetical protein
MNYLNNPNIRDSKSKDSNVIRYIPVDLTLRDIIAEQIQTQDVFHIGFYPENNHLDIDVYEFLDFKDIYYEVKEGLCNLNYNLLIKNQVLNNLLKYKFVITKNMKFFGVSHCWAA